jgi:hypothetical protein
MDWKGNEAETKGGGGKVSTRGSESLNEGSRNPRPFVGKTKENNGETGKPKTLELDAERTDR